MAASTTSTKTGFQYGPLIAGWLLPGAGHFWQRKWIRGGLLLASIGGMFVLGIAMQGKLYTGAHDILDMLGLAGDLGSGIFYFISRQMGLGAGGSSGDDGGLWDALYRCRRAAEYYCRGGCA